MSGVAICLPAAGASSRMRGTDKLLEMVDGRPLLRRQAEMALATHAPVLVTLPPDRPARRAALDGLGGLTLREVDGTSGMSASMREAAHWATGIGAHGLMIVLADMPELETADLSALQSAFAATPDRVWRATDDSARPGHPVVIPRRLFAALARVSGDDGGRPVLAGEDIRTLPLDGRRATTDLDTPEAWAAWRNSRGH